MEYDFEIVYRPGRQNFVADTLSRPPSETRMISESDQSKTSFALGGRLNGTECHSTEEEEEEEERERLFLHEPSSDEMKNDGHRLLKRKLQEKVEERNILATINEIACEETGGRKTTNIIGRKSTIG